MAPAGRLCPFTWGFDTALGEAPRWGRWRDALGMDASRLDLFGRTAELIAGTLSLLWQRA